MFKKGNTTKFALILIVLTFIVGCVTTTQNKYQTNLTIEAEVAAVMEQYDMWYQMMEPDVQTEWEETFDPAFAQLDLLMDSYHNMLKNDLSTATILVEINRLKTRIMIELTKRMANQSG